MTEVPISNRHRRILWLLLVIAGGLMIAIALVADRLGFSEPGTFGIGRLLQVTFGSLLLLAGLLGKRIKSFYQGLPIVLLNTALLLAFLELGLIVIARLGLVLSYWDVTLARYLELPYYREQEWTEEYWREAKLAEAYQYHAYVVWRHRPFVGNHVNINEVGIRDTPGADCSPAAYTVHTFGGSSMWGWGSPDWGTIAAYLQAGLTEVSDDPVCVVNIGEDAYVSTQSLVALKLQLQRGNVPDAIVFYDGVNDVYAAYESGQPGVHPMYSEVARRFEERENPLVCWLKRTRLAWLAKHLVSRFGDSSLLENEQPLANNSNGDYLDSLALSVADRYLGNYEIVSRLAREYGFKYYFFWQPHIAVGEKALTKHEMDMRDELHLELVELANAVYQYIEAATVEHENLWYLVGAFDNQATQIWIDAWGHITPEGNERLPARCWS
jgi:hypothetical protein